MARYPGRIIHASVVWTHEARAGDIIRRRSDSLRGPLETGARGCRCLSSSRFGWTPIQPGPSRLVVDQTREVEETTDESGRLNPRAVCPDATLAVVVKDEERRSHFKTSKNNLSRQRRRQPTFEAAAGPAWASRHKRGLREARESARGNFNHCCGSPRSASSAWARAASAGARP